MTSHTKQSLKPEVHPADHQQGLESAPVTLVEYGDYECPHCGAAHPVVQRLQRALGSKLRFVFRNFPLAEMHRHALHAAEAAESVSVQSGGDAYWRMHDALFSQQHALDDAHLAQYAAAAGADPSVVLSDLANAVHESQVKSDFVSGVRSGVNGTPTFFINGVRFDGDWLDGDEFAEALAAAE